MRIIPHLKAIGVFAVGIIVAFLISREFDYRVDVIICSLFIGAMCSFVTFGLIGIYEAMIERFSE